jgi:hypothetical protein
VAVDVEPVEGELQLVHHPGEVTRRAHRVRVEIDERQRGERLAAAGAPVAWDDALPGARRFYTEDPWGNRLELLAAA